MNPRPKLKLIGLTIAILFTGCGSCNDEGTNTNSSIRAQKRLCEETGGESSMSYYSETEIDDGYACSIPPIVPQDIPTRRPKQVTCTCISGRIYSDEEGCQAHPDPICTYTDNLGLFVSNMRSIAGSDAIDCGTHPADEELPAEARTCIADALDAGEAAALVQHRAPDYAKVVILEPNGGIIDVEYNKPDIYRRRCEREQFSQDTLECEITNTRTPD